MQNRLHKVELDAVCPVKPERVFGSAYFYEALAAQRFETTACNRCGRLAFPPVAVCPVCRCDELDWRVVPAQGTLFSSTLVYATPGSFSSIGPYRLGLIDLDAGLRLLCLLLAPSDWRAEIGQRMHLVVAQWHDCPMLAAMPIDDRRTHMTIARKPHGHPTSPQKSPSAFRALVCDQVDGGQRAAFQDITLADLPSGDVLVEVEYSSLNYKDGLVVTGKAPICRSFPMVAGIDLAGRVIESASTEFKVGDLVLVNGRGLSETRWGGYSRFQRLSADMPIALPQRFSTLQSMQIGTAGYTAMLCVMALQSRGLKPADGPVIVTGATGGVGTVAVSLLARAGYAVVAVTGRQEQTSFLKQLGATDVVGREEIMDSAGSMTRSRWAGAIDVVGGEPLAKLIAQMRYDGVVAACGMAAGGQLPVSVYPFILRGVSLLGVDSVTTPRDRRVEAWRRLAEELDLDALDLLSSVEPLSNIHDLAEAIIAGQTRGRVAIDVKA